MADFEVGKTYNTRGGWKAKLINKDEGCLTAIQGGGGGLFGIKIRGFYDGPEIHRLNGRVYELTESLMDLLAEEVVA